MFFKTTCLSPLGPPATPAKYYLCQNGDLKHTWTNTLPPDQCISFQQYRWQLKFINTQYLCLNLDNQNQHTLYPIPEIHLNNSQSRSTTTHAHDYNIAINNRNTKLYFHRCRLDFIHSVIDPGVNGLIKSGEQVRVA